MITEERSFCVTQLLASRAERYKFGWAEWRGTHPLKSAKGGPAELWWCKGVGQPAIFLRHGCRRLANTDA